jgi:hypothetical protein
MALYWMIDSKERLFTGAADGEVTMADAMGLLDAPSWRGGPILPQAVRWQRHGVRHDYGGVAHGVCHNQVLS